MQEFASHLCHQVAAPFGLPHLPTSQWHSASSAPHDSDHGGGRAGGGSVLRELRWDPGWTRGCGGHLPTVAEPLAGWKLCEMGGVGEHEPHHHFVGTGIGIVASTESGEGCEPGRGGLRTDVRNRRVFVINSRPSLIRLMCSSATCIYDVWCMDTYDISDIL